MRIHLLKSKLHRAAVTAADVNYEGSLGIDAALMDQVGLRRYERILCGNQENGERFETYVIPAKRGSGDIILNGATAHLGKVGDLLTIMSFAEVEESEVDDWKPRMMVLGKNNAVLRPSIYSPEADALSER